MAADKQLRDLAKKLVEISIQNGEVSTSRVGEVLQSLAAGPPRNHKPLLRLFQKYVTREIASYTADVEHAGPISEKITRSVKEFLEGTYGMRAQVDLSYKAEMRISGGKASLPALGEFIISDFRPRRTEQPDKAQRPKSPSLGVGRKR